MAKQDRKSFFSEWLEKLQQESWQLELLISGLALYGIYESQDQLIELKMYVMLHAEGNARRIQYIFLDTLGVGRKIFFINLLIHVILRSLWIGTIGLRYVSQDIDYEALNYSEHFTKLLQNRVGKFDDFIERLEKICSVLFAYTFLLFLLFFSFSFFFVQIALIPSFSQDLPEGQAFILGLFLILYILVGLVVFFDFITLGIFKKIENKIVNKFYGYIFIFYGWTTLTFLYRPLLYNFLDNKYTKRLFYFSIPYILILLAYTHMLSSNNYAFYPPNTISQKFGNTINKMNYEDLRKEYMTEVDSRLSKRRQNLPSVVINKYMNDEDYLKIFLKMSPSDYKLIQKYSDLDPYWKVGLSFTLKSTENKDSFYVNANKILENELDSLRIIRRKLRHKKKSLNDTSEINSITKQMSSIASTISDKRKEFDAKIDLFEEQKLKNTIDAYLDLIVLEINDSDVKPDIDCYFFQHSNNNEKGLMCMYPMDSLAMGKQELYYYKEEERLSRSRNIKMPFYKVKNYD